MVVVSRSKSGTLYFTVEPLYDVMQLGGWISAEFRMKESCTTEGC
jgi:hypothetical protein